MPPAPHEYTGRAAIAGFLRAGTTWRPDITLRLDATGFNSQPAYDCFFDGRPAGTIELTTSAYGISRITRFLHVYAPVNQP